MRYVFNSDHAGALQEEIVERLRKRDNVRFQDTAGADQGQKDQLYRNILSPLSIINGKDLSRFKDEETGEVRYHQGVLITPDTYYEGAEVLDFLEEE